MSQESSNWLNTMTLVGFTSKRGQAWHYRAEDQGDEPNHYPEAIPVDDVLRRLFDFTVVEAKVLYELPDGRIVPSQAERKGMLASDNAFDMGVFMDGYQGHSYQEWLLSNVATILDDDLGIASAGLLKKRGQAWVQVEVPETLSACGFEYRPSLLAATSFDGSLASTYGRKVQAVVCDNTLNAAMGEAGQSLKIKHTKNSGIRIKDAREALAIVHTMGEDFAQEVEALTATAVSEAAFQRVLDLVLPLPDPTQKVKSSNPRKRNEIVQLYRADERCAPWAGTAFGVLQTFNTWQHHVATVKGDKGRVQRNYERAITNVGQRFDAEILTAVAAAVQHDAA